MDSESPAREVQPFREARRVLSGVTAGGERRALRWLVERVPPGATSDHLTLLGFGATAAAGALYAASARYPWLLLVVNVALALTWLGDSLDGTLARHRRCERPRFGFYADHLADAFGALFLLAGLGASGLMSPLVAAVVLAAYLLLAVETYLATYTLGSFRISWGPVGGTELRIILALLNVGVLLCPRVALAGTRWLLFDLAGLLTAAVLTTVAAIAGVCGTRALARIEGWAASPTASGCPPAPARPRPTSAAQPAQGPSA